MLDKNTQRYLNKRRSDRKNKRKNKKMFKKIFLIGFILLTIVAGTVFGAKRLLEPKEKDNVKAEKDIDIEIKGKKLETENKLVSTIKDNKRLILIDNKHKVEEYTQEDAINKFNLVETFPALPVKTSNLLMEKTTFEETKNWVSLAIEKGFTDLIIISGYRSYEEQKELYEESIDKDFVQTPGSSEHNMGIAIDFIAKGVLDEDLDKTLEGQWLKDSASQFGFILRYPDNKKNITNINYEPWHFRYVGKPHSDIIKSKKLVLEEYLDLLRKKETITYKDDENEYWIYYVKEKNGKVLVPKTEEYEISSDNSGGYIITIKKQII